MSTRERDRTRRAQNLTDAGNAVRFATEHGAAVRYCYAQRSWYIWSGTHWQRDAGDIVMRLAKETAKALYIEAAQGDEERRKATGRWAMRSEDERHLRAMVSLARSEPGIPVLPEALDFDPWRLNCANGTLDLTTGTLARHRREDLITKCLPMAYDEAAACPEFHAFLTRIFDGRAAVMTFLQRALGYALTGDTSEQALFVFWGIGGNGKTTLLTTAVTMLGDYACSTRPETFMVKHGDQIPNDIARLKGMRLVMAVEAEGRLAESLVKQMSGQDPLSARFMRQEFFEFVPTFKVFLATNHKPDIRDTTHAMWRRVKLVPFTVTIPDDEKDTRLADKLRAELPGILAWAVRGCLAWQREGSLAEPDEVRAATAEYRAEMDVLGGFLRERCAAEPAAKIGARALYQTYEAWAHQAGQKTPLTETSFSLRLSERGFTKKHGRTGNTWHGLRPRTALDDEPDWVTEPTEDQP